MDESAAQVLLATLASDSIRTVAGRLQRPYETVRQTVDRLEDAGFVDYDGGLVVTNDHVREAARELLSASARVSLPTITEVSVLQLFFDRP